MRYRRVTTTCFAVAVAAGLVAAVPRPVSGQSGRAVAGKHSPLRTADGHPNLEGIWDFRTITPLQRPDEYAGKEVLTDREAADFERKYAQNQDNRESTPTTVQNGVASTRDVDRAYNDFWWDFGKKVVGTRRTSLIVDPPDGKMPPLTPEAKARAEVRRSAYQRAALGPEDRGVSERCLLGFNSGPPMLPSAYNNNLQIVQNADHLVLLNEMVHNARIVPLDGRPHVPPGVRQWVGDSRGHWEADTLVVETTNFRLTERFKRVEARTLHYEFTVNDPTTWTAPWTAQIPMTKSEEPLYEYACHEGNYGMMNLLSAARAVEKEQASIKK
jgi:hypothetical protein